MAVTATSYNNYLVERSKGSVALLTDTIKVALLSAAFVPNRTTQKFWSDISANEMTGTGYTAGGQALAGKALTQDDVNNRGVFSANNVTWANSTITNARYGAVYKDTGVGTTSILLGYIDFGANQSTSGTDFVIQWAATGVLYDQG